MLIAIKKIQNNQVYIDKTFVERFGEENGSRRVAGTDQNLSDQQKEKCGGLGFGSGSSGDLYRYRICVAGKDNRLAG